MRIFSKRKGFIALMSVVLVLISGCGALSSSDPLIGIWEADNIPMRLTFSEEGTFINLNTDNGQTANGFWERTNSNEIMLSASSSGEAQMFTIDFSDSENTLHLNPFGTEEILDLRRQ